MLTTLEDRRVGLEQEFFLVDEDGVLSNRADEFLTRCREAAVAAGRDPGSYAPECARPTTCPRRTGRRQKKTCLRLKTSRPHPKEAEEASRGSSPLVSATRQDPGALRFSFEEQDSDDEHAYHRYCLLDRHRSSSSHFMLSDPA